MISKVPLIIQEGRAIFVNSRSLALVIIVALLPPVPPQRSAWHRVFLSLAFPNIWLKPIILVTSIRDTK